MSGHKLLRRDDLGMVIDCAYHHERKGVLADLSFQSKFARKTQGILQRIGKGADGYDRLALEFASALEEIRKLLGEILDLCPDAAPARKRYLALTPEGLEELLALTNDLSWYKNWLIDRP